MRTLGIVAVALALAGCSPPPPDKGSATEKIVDDNQLLRQANEASGDVVRAAGDCEAVKSALPTARQKLAEIEGQLRTETGRVTFGAVKKRVEDIAQMCP